MIAEFFKSVGSGLSGIASGATKAVGTLAQGTTNAVGGVLSGVSSTVTELGKAAPDIISATGAILPQLAAAGIIDADSGEKTQKTVATKSSGISTPLLIGGLTLAGILTGALVVSMARRRRK